MTNLPPVTTLEIFTRNRLRDGWTRKQIIDALKRRMRWGELDTEKMTPVSKARYPALVEFMTQLEKGDTIDA